MTKKLTVTAIIFFVLIIVCLFKIDFFSEEKKAREKFLFGFFENALKIKNEEYFKKSIHVKTYNDDQLAGYNNFLEKNGFMLSVARSEEKPFNIELNGQVFRVVNCHFNAVFTKKKNVIFSATLIQDNKQWYFYGFNYQ